MTATTRRRPTRPHDRNGRATIPAAAGGGRLGRVAPNSRTHWALLLLGLAGSVLFNLTWFVDGLLQPGYDPLYQPVSALSLGREGWVQIANFAVFGVIGCAGAFASRPTLAPGLGTVWYPRLRVLSGLAMIATAVFSQDPALGYPVGVAAPDHPSLHAQIHNITAYISLIAIVAQLVVMARRLHREPDWRGWGVAAAVAAVLMMTFLALFGVLIAQHGPGGIFEKLASLTPTVFGAALTIRLLVRRDARITTRPAG